MLAEKFAILTCTWCLLLTTVLSVCPKTSQEEVSALKDLYDETGGNSWKYSGVKWNFADGSDPCCSSWAGIVCGQSSNIVQLNVVQFGLEGNIPSSFGNLSALQILGMGYNKLKGSLPASILNLKNVTMLDFSNNHLSGEFNFNFPKVTTMFLNDNLFSGTILDKISKYCSNLVALNIANNKKFSGSIPKSFASNCSILSSLNISYNSFTGELPSNIVDMKELAIIDVSKNSLSGSIPRNILTMAKLEWVTLAKNQFEGTLPDIIDPSHFPSIVSFSGNKNLHGTIPVGYYTRGKLVYLHDNHLSGALPILAQPTTTLKILDLYNNDIKGSLEPIMTMPSLIYGKFSKNGFGGTLDFMENASFNGSSLKIFDISENKLSGSLPRALFTRLTSIIAMSLDSNCFHVEVPAEICNATTLEQLSINGLHTATRGHCTTRVMKSYYSNYIRYSNLPTCLFAMPKLQHLYAASNKLHIALESIKAISPSLTSLILSHNVIYGSLPLTFMRHAWEILDLSYNQIGGVLTNDMKVPTTQLNLRVNLLSGEVPQILLNTLQQINILTGNFFRCKVTRSDLPKNDKEPVARYVCGSNDANESLLLFATIIFIVIVVWIASVHCQHQYTSFAKLRRSLAKMVMYSKHFASVCEENKEELISLWELKLLITNFAKACMVYTGVLFFVLFPLYEVLNNSDSKVQYQDVWQYSATFLKGQTSAAILFAIFLVFMGAAYVLHNMITQTKYIGPGVSGNVYSISMLRYRLVQLGVIVLNVIIVLPLNMGYVYYTSGRDDNPYSRALLNIAVAFIKICWTSFFVPMTLKKGYQYFVKSEEVFHHPSSTMLMAWIVLLNNIMCPLVATAMFNKDCFYHLIHPANAVEVQVQDFTYCFSNRGACTKVPGYTRSSTPPFLYSYHCSNSLLQKYASVFITMAMMEAFGKPMVAWVINQLYKKALQEHRKGTKWFWALEVALPAALRRWGGKELPAFEKHHFVMVLTYQTTVLLMIGVIFPPVAVVTCIAIVSQLYITRMQMGYLFVTISNKPSDDIDVSLTTIDQQCAKVGLLLNRCLTASFVFAGIVYASVLVDTIGGKMWSSRYIALPIVIVALPLGKFVSMTCDVAKKLLECDEDYSCFRCNEGRHVLPSSDSEHANPLLPDDACEEEDVRHVSTATNVTMLSGDDLEC